MFVLSLSLFFSHISCISIENRLNQDLDATSPMTQHKQAGTGTTGPKTAQFAESGKILRAMPLSGNGRWSISDRAIRQILLFGPVIGFARR